MIALLSDIAGIVAAIAAVWSFIQTRSSPSKKGEDAKEASRDE